MNHDQIYRKVGRRYIPVGIFQEPNWYPPGCSLVVVDKDCTSIQYQHVTPTSAPLLAAFRKARDQMDRVVRDAFAARPTKQTARELKAWSILRRELPGDLIMVQWPAIRDITDALENELVRLVTEEKANPPS
jgi:hypothetical protein